MKKAMYTGRMDRRVDIIRLNKEQSASGAEIRTKETLVTVWASREVAKSDEELDDKVVAVDVYEYLIRYHPSIAEQKIQQLLLKDINDEFKIDGVEVIGRKQFLKVKCSMRE